MRVCVKDAHLILKPVMIIIIIIVRLFEAHQYALLYAKFFRVFFMLTQLSTLYLLPGIVLFYFIFCISITKYVLNQSLYNL